MKPIWALAGVALLGTAGVAGALIVASSGGEEEVVQQVQTATGTSASTPTPSQHPLPTAVPVTSSPAPTPAPSEDPIPADWATYADPVLGFSLRYPPDLTLRDLTGPPGGLGNQRALDFRSDKDPSRAIALSVYANSSDLTPDEWARQNTACLQDTFRNGAVAGRTAIFCTAEAIEGVFDSGVVFEYQENIFYVSSTVQASEFDTVLASVRLGSS